MAAFKYILLDFDGVVADTESVFAAFDCNVLNQTLAKAGYEPDLKAEYVRKLAGIPAEDKLKIIAKEKSFDAEPYIDGFISLRNQARPSIFREARVPFARNFEAFIEKHKSRCVLVTNKNREKLDWDLDAMGLRETFPLTVCLEAPMKRKPAPDLLLKGLKIAGANADEAAYVGDNELDMEAAVAAGVYPIGFIIEGISENPGRALELQEAGARIVLDNFAALAEYLE